MQTTSATVTTSAKLPFLVDCYLQRSRVVGVAVVTDLQRYRSAVTYMVGIDVGVGVKVFSRRLPVLPVNNEGEAIAVRIVAQTVSGNVPTAPSVLRILPANRIAGALTIDEFTANHDDDVLAGMAS